VHESGLAKKQSYAPCVSIELSYCRSVKITGIKELELTMKKMKHADVHW
jgi:hypothetical protein